VHSIIQIHHYSFSKQQQQQQQQQQNKKSSCDKNLTSTINLSYLNSIEFVFKRMLITLLVKKIFGLRKGLFFIFIRAVQSLRIFALISRLIESLGSSQTLIAPE
jgi:hypothetical protein